MIPLKLCPRPLYVVFLRVCILAHPLHHLVHVLSLISMLFFTSPHGHYSPVPLWCMGFPPSHTHPPPNPLLQDDLDDFHACCFLDRDFISLWAGVPIIIYQCVSVLAQSPQSPPMLSRCHSACPEPCSCNATSVERAGREKRSHVT